MKRFAKAVLTIVAAHAFALGCGSALKTIDQLNDPNDDKDLRDCRYVGRQAQDAGRDAADAFDAYRECTKEAGLR